MVFNNAGYGLAGALEGLTDEQILRMVNTNMLGAIRVTKAFTPHFREKRAGLFINTTSIGGLLTVPFNSIYHATKWALEGWSESMAFELNQFGIGIKTIEPGGMKTDFFTRSFDTGGHPAYDALVNRVMGIITDPKQIATYSSPEQIAEVVHEAARTEKTNSAILLGQTQRRCMLCACSLGKKRSAMRWLCSFLGMQKERLSFDSSSSLLVLDQVQAPTRRNVTRGSRREQHPFACNVPTRHLGNGTVMTQTVPSPTCCNS